MYRRRTKPSRLSQMGYLFIGNRRSLLISGPTLDAQIGVMLAAVEAGEVYESSRMSALLGQITQFATVDTLALSP